MNKRQIVTLILLAYCLIVIKVLVFKDIPMIRIGRMRLSFGGTQEGEPNFVPFKTILQYLKFRRGILISAINIIGNIFALVPVGFLVPAALQNIGWKKIIVFAVAAGIAIETLQAILRVGIFDVDDVILNGFGVVVGYWAFRIISTLRLKFQQRVSS